jgi:hypothetical protein
VSVWIALHPLLAVVLSLLLGITALVVFWVVWCHLRTPGWHRFAMVIKWQAIDPMEDCPECDGIGLLDKNKNKLYVEPGKQGEAFQHLALREGTNRDCGGCGGWGKRPRRLPKPRQVHPGQVPPKPRARKL